MWEIPSLIALGFFCIAAAIFLGFRIVGRLRGLPVFSMLLAVGLGIAAALFGFTVLRMFDAQVKEISPFLANIRENYFIVYFILGAYAFPLVMGLVTGFLIRNKLPAPAVIYSSLLSATFIVFQPLGHALIIWLFNKLPG